MPTEPLTAIVLNYGRLQDTAPSIQSLLLSVPKPLVVVVDNGPYEDDESTLPVHPEVTYLRTGRNLGFSGGMNAGIRHALDRGATRIALINSDAVVSPDCLARLDHVLKSVPGAGIAGPMLVDRSVPETISSLGLSYHPTTGRMRVLASGEPRSSSAQLPSREVDAVSGCIMLIAREVLESVGLLDEDYFFGFEDLDFCLTARRKGFKTIAVPGAVAYHEGGRSIGAASPRRLYFAARNHLRLAGRVAPAGAILSGCRALVIVVLNLAHAARPSDGSALHRLRAVITGTRDHLASRYGSGA